MTLPHGVRGGDGGEEHGSREDEARSEMTRLATAEAEFRFAVQGEQAALMASGLGRIEVRETGGGSESSTLIVKSKSAGMWNPHCFCCLETKCRLGPLSRENGTIQYERTGVMSDSKACMCVCERERESEREGGRNLK